LSRGLPFFRQRDLDDFMVITFGGMMANRCVPIFQVRLAPPRLRRFFL
jgi:hypothetical protein